MKKYLSADQFKLYQLIWQRFMASQMTPAVFDTTTVDFDIPSTTQPDIGRRGYLFRARARSCSRVSGAVPRGARRANTKRQDYRRRRWLPSAKRCRARASLQPVRASRLPRQPRKELERLALPAFDHASIIVLADRRYVELLQRRFFPTELGESVEKVMVKQFPDVFNVDFTSEMEGELDKIEDGDLGWQKVLKDFYSPFAARLNKVDAGALIAEAYDLSAIDTLRCPEDGGKPELRGNSSVRSSPASTSKNCTYTRADRRGQPAMTEHMCQPSAAVSNGHSPAQRASSSMRTPEMPWHTLDAHGSLLPKGWRRLAMPSPERRTAFYACSNEECGFRGVEQARR